MKSNGAGGWVSEDVPFNALCDSLGQLTSFTAVGTSPVFQWGHTYSHDTNANSTGVTVTTNAAGDITSLLGKTLAYHAAGRLSEATAVPPCPSGVNCSGQQTTLSRFNGWDQRFLRDTPNWQSVFSYGTEGFNLLSETTRNLSTSALSTTEHIWLPTASGPMPIAAVIDGVHYAVHADHLNTPRRLTDASKAVKCLCLCLCLCLRPIAQRLRSQRRRTPCSTGLRSISHWQRLSDEVAPFEVVDVVQVKLLNPGFGTGGLFDPMDLIVRLAKQVKNFRGRRPVVRA